MDPNISRWLKDDLKLVHMSETDLNGLMFHPRHGSLCRRLVKFLAESTLCSVRYPTVYAKEEYEEAIDELSKKRQIRQGILDKLYNYVKDQENIETEVSFLARKLDYLKRIEDLQQTSRTAMEDIVNRPNFNLEQASRTIESANYLTDHPLDNLYSSEDIDKPIENLPTEIDISAADESLTTIVHKVNVMHIMITKLYEKITQAIDKNHCDVSLKKLQVADLVALKVPIFKELVLDADPIQKELKRTITGLCHRVQELNQQVCEMKKKYLKERGDIIKVAKESLTKHIAKFDCPDKIVARIEKLDVAINTNNFDPEK